jgi:hypothetical protein
MQILNQNPPNILEIAKYFDVQENTVYCYGDKLYNPGGGFVDPSLLAHEKTHSRQQAEIGPAEWWRLYLKFDDFRVSQEVEAYQNQYQVLKQIFKDRNRLNFHLVRIAKELSGSLYGNMMSFGEASKAIKSEKKYKFDISKLK